MILISCIATNIDMVAFCVLYTTRTCLSVMNILDVGYSCCDIIIIKYLGIFASGKLLDQLMKFNIPTMV